MQLEVEILNELGLHARPAAEFVRCVHKFKSTVVLRKGAETFSGGSILEVLTANLDCGARVIIEAEGEDAAAALEKLALLLVEFREQEERERCQQK